MRKKLLLKVLPLLIFAPLTIQTLVSCGETDKVPNVPDNPGDKDPIIPDKPDNPDDKDPTPDKPDGGDSEGDSSNPENPNNPEEVKTGIVDLPTSENYEVSITDWNKDKTYLIGTELILNINVHNGFYLKSVSHNSNAIHVLDGKYTFKVEAGVNKITIEVANTPTETKRYSIFSDNLQKETDKFDLATSFNATENLIYNVDGENLYSVNQNNYAIRIGTNAKPGSLTFTFKDNVFINNLNLNLAKTDDSNAKISIMVGHKVLSSEINNEIISFKNVNVLTDTIKITKFIGEGSEKFKNSFYFKGLEINGGETPNVPIAKVSKVTLENDAPLGGRIKFDNVSNNANLSVGTEVRLKLTPDKDYSIKSLIVNDGTIDLDIKNTNSFKILKENVTYTVKAVFDKNTPSDVIDKNFKVLFDTFTSNSTKFDESIANDPENMISSIGYTNINPTHEEHALQIGSKSSVGKITFGFSNPILVSKLTLITSKGMPGAIANVTIGSDIFKYPADREGEVTLPLNKSITTNSITIENEGSAMRFLLKGFEINGTQEETVPPVEEKEKAHIKWLQPKNGNIVFGDRYDNDVYVDVGTTIKVLAYPNKGFKLDKITVKDNGVLSDITKNKEFIVTSKNHHYIVEALFIEDTSSPTPEPEKPVIPQATNSKVIFDRINGNDGGLLSPTTIKQTITNFPNEIETLKPRQCYQMYNTYTKFSGIRLGTAPNAKNPGSIGEFEIDLKLPTIIKNVSLDLGLYQVEKVLEKDPQGKPIKKEIITDDSRIAVILDEKTYSGEYDARNGKIIIPFDNVVASKIIIRTCGVKERVLISAFEINYNGTEVVGENASNVKINSTTNGEISIIGRTNNSKVNLGNTVNLKVAPSENYSLKSLTVDDGLKTIDVTKTRYFRIIESNKTYTVNAVFALTSELPNDSLNETYFVSFDKNVMPHEEHFVNWKSAITDSSNIIQEIVKGDNKFYGGDGLRITNKAKNKEITVNLTQKINISNIAINLNKFNEMDSCIYNLRIDDIYSTKPSAVLAYGLQTFTFESSILTDHFTIELDGDNEINVLLKNIIFNYGIDTTQYEDYAPLNESASVEFINKENLSFKHIDSEGKEVLPIDELDVKSGEEYVLHFDSSINKQPTLIINGKYFILDENQNYFSDHNLIIKLESGHNIVEILFN